MIVGTSNDYSEHVPVHHTSKNMTSRLFGRPDDMYEVLEEVNLIF